MFEDLLKNKIYIDIYNKSKIFENKLNNIQLYNSLFLHSIFMLKDDISKYIENNLYNNIDLCSLIGINNLKTGLLLIFQHINLMTNHQYITYSLIKENSEIFNCTGKWNEYNPYEKKYFSLDTFPENIKDIINNKNLKFITLEEQLKEIFNK